MADRFPILDRVLSVLGDDEDGAVLEKSRALVLALLSLSAGHTAHSAIRLWRETGPNHTVIAGAVALTLAAVLAFRGASLRLACGLVAPFVALRLIETFPGGYNHLYLECILLTVGAVYGREHVRDRRELLWIARWLAVVGFFWAGAQKLWYGQYLRGEFFTLLVASDPRFNFALGWLVPPEELLRLESYPIDTPGSGPYRIHSPILVVLSNLGSWLELACAGLLAHRATRRVGVVATIVVVLAIEAVAREFYYGLMFVSLVLAFAPARALQRFVPVAVATAIGLTVVHFVFPDLYFN